MCWTRVRAVSRARVANTLATQFIQHLDRWRGRRPVGAGGSDHRLSAFTGAGLPAQRPQARRRSGHSPHTTTTPPSRHSFASTPLATSEFLTCHPPPDLTRPLLSQHHAFACASATSSRRQPRSPARANLPCAVELVRMRIEKLARWRASNMCIRSRTNSDCQLAARSLHVLCAAGLPRALPVPPRAAERG